MKSSDVLKRSIQEHLDRKNMDSSYRDSYECAYKDLLLWRVGEEEKAEKLPHFAGLDGPQAERMQEIGTEYRRMLSKLKAQYNID